MLTGMRQYLGAIIGVVVGAMGVILFGQSQSPPEGSLAERLEKTEDRLRTTERRLRSYDTVQRQSQRMRHSDGARQIMEDIRSGEGASMDDIFAMAQPWLINISPLLNRIRVKEEKNQFNAIGGEWGRKYELTDRQQKALRNWLDKRAEENAETFVKVLTDEKSTVMDILQAGRDAENNLRGIEQFMEGQLRGQVLADFKQDRVLDRVESVQREANGRLHRLDRLVELDADQEDKLFYLMARSSDDYTPQMEIEGMTGSQLPMDSAARNSALREVLRPEQLSVFDERRAQRRAQAEQEVRELGLRMPEGWDVFEDDDW